MRVAPAQRPHDAARVRIEQELVGIEAMTLFGLVGTVDAISVELPGTKLRQVAVPHEIGALAQRDALQLPFPGLVEEAQLHLLGVAREESEVHAFSVPRGAERMRKSVPPLDSGMVHQLLVHFCASSRRPRMGMASQSGRLSSS